MTTRGNWLRTAWMMAAAISAAVFAAWHGALAQEPAPAQEPTAAIQEPQPATPEPAPAKQESAPPAIKPLEPAAEVRLEYPFNNDADWRESFEAIARHLVAINEKLVSPEPFYGRRPFVLRQSYDGMPRASEDPTAYIVFVCPNPRWYAQFVYQFGHELGHYWIGHRSSGQFQESVCTALMLADMDELARHWEAPGASPKQAAWAADLRDYHNWVSFRPEFDRLGLRDVDAAAAWTRQNGSKLLQTWNRDEQTAMAKVIERILRRHPGQWAALKKLGNVTGFGDPGMFARWRDLVEPGQRPLVEDLADAFGAPIAATVSDAATNQPPAAAAPDTTPAPKPEP